MRIQRNVWVTLKFKVSDSLGEAIESGANMVTYLHGGYGAVFPAIEEALEGCEPGSEVNVYLEPEDAFGDYDAELVRMEQRERFPEPLECGLQFEGIPGDEDSPTIVYTITDLTPEVVVLDGNHPLAGMSLRFEVEVVEVHEATEDEVNDERDKAQDPMAHHMGYENLDAFVAGLDDEEQHEHNGHEGHDEEGASWRSVKRTLH